MTNIDHDALARRIAEDLMTDGQDRLASKLKFVDRVGGWAIDAMVPVIVATLREALPTSEDVCEWTGSEVEMSGKWDTSCRRSFYVVDDSPKENGFRFCCYCGKKLIEVPFEDDEDFES